MSARDLAKKMAVAANVLLAASLFMALIWFMVSVVLFAACLVLHGASWLVDNDVVAASRLPTTPE